MADTITLSDAMGASLPANIRFIFVLLLLLHQIHSLIVECFYIYAQPRPLFKPPADWDFGDPMLPPPTWTWTYRTRWIVLNALAMFFVGIIFSAFAFRNAADFQRDLNSQCDAQADGDIAGVGVRVAFWIQIGMLVFIVGIKSVAISPSNAAVKELAGGLVITHLSLGISLLVLSHQGKLSGLNAALGAMVLDAQNVALSVSFSSREVLAARSEVVTIAITQFTGLVWIGVLMSGYTVGRYQTDDCPCFSFFWWSWHDTCLGVPMMETSIFWVYYDFRWLNSIHNWLFGLRYMWDFHLWEKYASDDLDVVEPFWTHVPEMVGFSLFRHAVFGLGSLAAAELTLRAHNGGRGPEEFTVGQVTGIVVASLTFLRAAWLFLVTFSKD
ncbi:hypothetical protein B0J18DRAFT_417447 [Chaetomium sp. MPI-SDFR-AT-0129]|nr:hypothetical protein B0J18DRAFT_417447 [Chaetomium sp. MPI-SDFR-AT-0129]